MNSATTDDPFGSVSTTWPSPTSIGGNGSTISCDNGTRFGAYLLDAVLMIVTFGIGWFIWSIVLWQKSTSPGKKMLGLMVVDVNTGQPASVGTMALRELVGKTLLSWLSCGLTSLVGAIMILATEKRQGIWDQIATTTVVKVIR
jgi:uncharacterized RDD family membrane protein YckC